MDLFTTITFSVSALSDVSETLPFLVWLFFARKKETYLLLGIFFLISATLKLLSLITAKMDIHNMPIYHLLAINEVVMVFCFYSRLMFKKVNIPALILLIAISLFNSIFVQNIFTINSVEWTLDMLVLIVLGVVFLFKLYNNDNDDSPLEKRPDFIITVGWLIYAAGSLFTYLLATPILSGKAAGFFHNAWFFQCVFNLIKNVLISYGLWRAR